MNALQLADADYVLRWLIQADEVKIPIQGIPQSIVGLAKRALAVPAEVLDAGEQGSFAGATVADPGFRKSPAGNFDVSDWDVIPNYFCSMCGEPARGSPTVRTLWACKSCGIQSEDLLEHFDRVDPNAPKIKPVAEWEVIPGYFCRRCDDPARQNPTNKGSWGCAKCDGESSSLMLNFRSEGEQSRPSTAVAEAVLEVVHYFQSNVVQWEVTAALGGQAARELADEQRAVIGKAEIALLPILRNLVAPVCSCLPEQLRAVVLSVDAEAEEFRLTSRKKRANDWDQRLFERMEQARRLADEVNDLIRIIEGNVRKEGWEDRTAEIQALRFLQLNADALKDGTAEDYERF